MRKNDAMNFMTNPFSAYLDEFNGMLEGLIDNTADSLYEASEALPEQHFPGAVIKAEEVRAYVARLVMAAQFDTLRVLLTQADLLEIEEEEEDDDDDIP